MLYQLKEYGFPLDQSFSTPSSPHPVTELQELLQKRHIRSPSYAYVPHDGTHGHMKEYTCICRVEKFNLGKFQNIGSKVTVQNKVLAVNPIPNCFNSDEFHFRWLNTLNELD